MAVGRNAPTVVVTRCPGDGHCTVLRMVAESVASLKDVIELQLENFSYVERMEADQTPRILLQPTRP